ncbi:MAG: glycyl-radical enzyme activating protein [Deltaproteobacteria bacterium]|nr:glycyl-radical enzyme activating protein [Deltaproteobacteria bacterium]
MASGPQSPLVVDIKRNSLDDGPGIRSVVFFKGCPLRCVWCQNPESLSAKAQIQLEPERCLDCGDCLAACPDQIATSAREQRPSPQCRVCGSCVEACPSGARRIVGTVYTIEQLFELVAKDEPFYRHSGGGVTFSGGEPALFPHFAGDLARLLQAKGIHVLVETAGLFDWTSFEQNLMPHLSSIYFDLKIADPEIHKQLVGTSNQAIHANLKSLIASGFKDLLVRLPLIPGVTDTYENLTAIADLINRLGLERIKLLPYNPLWISKRRALGMQLDYQHDSFMQPEEIERCQQVFERVGIKTTDSK